MNREAKELWVIPIIIAVVTGVPLGAGFMFLGFWLAGTPIHVSFSFGWLKMALSTPLPVWITLNVLAVAATVVALFFRQLARTAEEKARSISAENRIIKLDEAHAAEIERLKAKEPGLHGVWSQSQTFWHLGSHGEAPAMQIGGWIDLTTRNTKDTMFLLAGYIGEHRSQIFMPVEVKPNLVNGCMVMLSMVPPLETDVTKSYDATIVVEDQYNRKFSLPAQRFRATPGKTPFPADVPGTPVPKLHISWRGNSGWCWVRHGDGQALRISGDGLILLENMEERVIVTGVLVEGAEFVGIFDNFALNPGEPTFRGMNLDFKGINPADREPIKVKLTLVDLRGKRYPADEITFKPLSAPLQHGGLPWRK